MRAFIVATVATLAALPAVAQNTAEEPDEAEVQCVAEAVYHEARGTSETSQEAVAHVIVNRTKSEDFPDDVCAVIEDGCQFSYECDGKSEAMTESEAREEAIDTAEAVLEGANPDPTGGALYYHNGAVKPEWADEFRLTAKIGGHTFYRPR
jgi:spore germination cell wall hydrolase CwlJ-like protein